MTNIFIKMFIKNYNQTESPPVREQYGILGSIVGIVCNVILFLVKIFIGTVLNSIAIQADSFNNLSDAGSSIVSLVGFRLANKPPDAEHPFGHGRTEYITSLLISLVIMLLGYEFLKDAIYKIFHPEPVAFATVSFIILVLTVFLKLWLSFFYRTLSKKINSTTFKATAKDSMNDVIITSSTIFSITVSALTGLNIDGYIGVAVAGFLLYGGFQLARETLSPLLGERPSQELATQIRTELERYDGILGSHDLIVHDYGPNRRMATIHAEVSSDVSIQISHDLIDRAEREIQQSLGIFLLIHMDPVSTHDARLSEVKDRVQQLLSTIDPALNAHDFRIVDSDQIINIIFDLAVPYEFKSAQIKELLQQIQSEMSQIDKRYNIVINVEYCFTSL